MLGYLGHKSVTMSIENNLYGDNYPAHRLRPPFAPLHRRAALPDRQCRFSGRPPLLTLFALDRSRGPMRACAGAARSEEHTSELQSLMRISYAVFCLKKKKPLIQIPTNDTT